MWWQTTGKLTIYDLVVCVSCSLCSCVRVDVRECAIFIHIEILSTRNVLQNLMCVCLWVTAHNTRENHILFACLNFWLRHFLKWKELFRDENKVEVDG